MANFFALRPVDITGLDISGLQGAHDEGFDSDAFETLHGKVYEDVIWFEEFDGLGGGSATAFGGTGFQVNLTTGEVTGGTVTGVLAEQWTGSAWAKHWFLEDVSVSAAAIYDAAMTAATADDFALVASVLAGADTFTLSSGADVMRGYAGNDTLRGNGGSDRLSGDGGNDTLVGGTGADTLFGNAGADVFDYNAAAESGPASRDTIRDFVRGADRIDLSGIDANGAIATNQAFTGFIRATADFTRAGQLKFVDGVLFGNTDGDAAAEFAIVLTGVTALGVGDLVL